MPRKTAWNWYDPRVIDPTFASLRDVAEAALRPSVAGTARCALLGYPNHANPGDSAIWLGAKRWLAASVVRVAYQCDRHFYDAAALATACPDGPIFLIGGGNFGDLWPDEQAFRERVLRDFPDRSVVQLPQSVLFKDRASTERFRTALKRPGPFTAYVRDADSKKRFEDAFDAEATLCPDMAVFLGERRRPTPPTTDVVRLLRGDRESMSRRSSGPDAWMHSPSDPAVLALRTLGAAKARMPLPRLAAGIAARLYDPVAESRVAFAERTLARGRVVVTDRLHGHIMSLALGIPNVVVDNSYGKVHSFIREWTKDSPLVACATNPDEADVLARKFLAKSSV